MKLQAKQRLVYASGTEVVNDLMGDLAGPGGHFFKAGITPPFAVKDAIKKALKTAYEAGVKDGKSDTK